MYRAHQRQLASPVKVRTTLVSGQKKMLVWNDLDPSEKVRVYDKGADVRGAGRSPSTGQLSYRLYVGTGGGAGSASAETRYFLIVSRTAPNPSTMGRLVCASRILEAAEQSLKQHREVAYASVR